MGLLEDMDDAVDDVELNRIAPVGSNASAFHPGGNKSSSKVEDLLDFEVEFEQLESISKEGPAVSFDTTSISEAK